MITNVDIKKSYNLIISFKQVSTMDYHNQINGNFQSFRNKFQIFKQYLKQSINIILVVVIVILLLGIFVNSQSYRYQQISTLSFEEEQKIIQEINPTKISEPKGVQKQIQLPELKLEQNPKRQKKILKEVQKEKKALVSGGRLQQTASPFPNIVWLYSQDDSKQLKQFAYYCRISVCKYSSNNDFKVIILTEGESEYNYLHQRSVKEIQSRLEQEHLKQSSEYKNLRKQLKRDLIKLYTLYEIGGVWIDDNVMLYEDISWVQKLHQNIFIINRELIDPEAFLFYNFDYSHPTIEIVEEKQSKEDQPFYHMNRKNVIVKSPSCQGFFIASKPKSKFIKVAIDNYIEMEHSIKYKFIFQSVGQINLETLVIQYKNILQKVFKEILEEKSQFQNDIDEIELEDDIQHLSYPIKTYKLWLMRSDLFAKKMVYFYVNDQERIVRSMTLALQQEVEQSIGPMKYIGYFPSEIVMHLNLYLAAARPMEDKFIIGSIFSNHLLEKQNKLKPSAFPRIIWLYWNSGYANLKIFQKMCLNNIKHYAQVSGYELRLLEDKNCYDYLSSQYIEVIESTLKNMKLKFQKTSKGDMLRIFLLIQHGGVWIDLSTMLLQDLSWLDNLRDIDEIVGKTIQPPKVLLFYNTRHIIEENYVYDRRTGLRVLPAPAFQTYFIAAVPQSQFLIDILDQQILCMLNYEGYYLEKLSKNKVEMGYYLRNSPYLIPMIAIQYVLQTKQRLLDEAHTNKFIVHEYGVWGLEVRVCAYKIQFNGDLDGTMKLPQFLITRSMNYTSQIFGKHKFLIKMNHYGVPRLEKQLDLVFAGKTTMDQNSYLRKHLLEIGENIQFLRLFQNNKRYTLV